MLRDRFWKVGVGVALFVSTLMIGNAVLLNRPSADGKSPTVVGLDFIAFYTAGSFVREGRADQLYNLPAVVSFQQALAAREGANLGGGFGPWWNPPFYALIFAPLAALPFATALSIWQTVSLISMVASQVLLCRMLPEEANWKTWGLVPLITLCSMPFILTISHGQNTCMSLLILCAVVTAWRAGKAVLAGAILGLLFYKPQLAAIVAVVLVLDMGWRSILGVAMTGTALLVVNLVLLPGTIGAFLHQMPLNLHSMMVNKEYMWERHVTLRAFWRLLFQGRGPAEAFRIVNLLTVAGTMAFGAGLFIAMWRNRRSNTQGAAKLAPNPVYRDRLIAAAIASMPLLMPFYFDYDLLLLTIPAVLLAGDWNKMAIGWSDVSQRWLIRAWISLFFWLMIANHITAYTRFNLTVPILGAIAGLLIHRAGWERRTRPRNAATPPSSSASSDMAIAA